MENTEIEYVHHSFSPWRGCSEVDAGCRFCFAKRGSERNPRMLGQWGEAGTRVVASRNAWSQMRAIDRKCGRMGIKQRVLCHWCDPFEDWTGPMIDHVGNRMEYCDQCKKLVWPFDKPCQCAKKFKRMATMHDVRHEYMMMIESCQNLTWLLTTKRPENIRMFWDGYSGFNVALGISVCNTADAAKKFDAFRDVMYLADTSWISAEPLIGPLDLVEARAFPRYECGTCGAVVTDHTHESDDVCRTCESTMSFQYDCVDWVVIGGESGAKARECNPDWIRKIMRDCERADVACFVKQVGTNPTNLKIIDPKGGNPAEWPEDLRVRNYPEAFGDCEDAPRN